MAYEGHIAGVGDRPPGKRAMGARDPRRCRSARPRRSASAAPRSWRPCGRSPSSSSSTAAAPAASRRPPPSTPSPRSPPAPGSSRRRLFDTYSSFTAKPAAMFALPVVRKPSPSDRDRARRRLPGVRRRPTRAGCPRPTCRAGLRLDGQEGAGEVQTPLLGEAARSLRGRRPRLLAPRQGGRAVRALRLAAAGRRRRDRRRAADLPRRGPGVPLERGLQTGAGRARPRPAPGPCRRCANSPSGSRRARISWKRSQSG